MAKLIPDLSSLYENPRQHAFLHSQYYVEGAILGACACPEIPLPNIWLPWVIKHHGQVQDTEQADTMTDILFAHFKHCLAQMHDATLKLPTYAVYSDQDSQALSEWCEGLLMAHSATESCWQGAWNKMQKQNPKAAPMMAKDLKHCLLMFTTFADPNKAIKDAAKKGDFELSQKLPQIAQSLLPSLRKYVAISGDLAAYLPNQFETFTQQQ